MSRRSTRALERLVKVLSGSPSKRFRIASTSHKGLEYEIVVADADVTCTCPGFEYRGQCRHARDVKAALASGQEVPRRTLKSGDSESIIRSGTKFKTNRAVISKPGF